MSKNRHHLPLHLLFDRLVQPPRAHRLRQCVALHAKAIGNLRRLQPFIQQLLGFDRPLEADLADPEGTGNGRLFGMTVDAELRKDAKRMKN